MSASRLARVVDTLLRAAGVAALVAVPFALSGSTITGLTTFTNGTVADASVVNANFAAVKTAVDDNAGRTVPPGAVQFFVGANCPTGWLKANGTTYNRSTYPALADALAAGATFVVPDLRGEFIRGFDDARGVEPAGARCCRPRATRRSCC